MAGSQRFRRFRKSSRTWDAPVLPIAFGLLGGLFAALAMVELERTARGLAAFPYEGSWAAVWAFLFGFVAVGLPVLTTQKAALRIMRYVRAVGNVQPYAGELLLGADGWAMDSIFGENLLQLIDEGPQHVVEVGSGHSSVLMAARLAQRGTGHLTAIDHLGRFADRTRTWIRDRGVESRATVVTAPLADHPIDGATWSWYDMSVLEGELPDRIDLLVVDGPPGQLGKDSRWPAVPLLKDRLADDVAIILDDGDRSDETRIAHSWRDILGSEIRYLPGGKGAWILRGKA
jgi:hypothetical protein